MKAIDRYQKSCRFSVLSCIAVLLAPMLSFAQTAPICSSTGEPMGVVPPGGNDGEKLVQNHRYRMGHRGLEIGDHG